MRVLTRPDWARHFTMKRIRHTAEQTIRRLKTAEKLFAQGETVTDVCRAIEVTHLKSPICWRWPPRANQLNLSSPIYISALALQSS